MLRRGSVGHGIGGELAAPLVVVGLVVGATALVLALSAGGSGSDSIDDRARPIATLPVSRVSSAVLIEVDGCAVESVGSGVAIEAGVLTNAHVVAGATEVRVVTTQGETLVGEIRAFDPILDLALVVVPALEVPAVPIGAPQGGAEATALVRSRDAVDVQDVRIERTINIISTDIYGDGEHTRRGVELAAEIDPGDSGGAVIDAEGDLVAVVFSASRRTPGVAYGISSTEVDDFVADASATPVEPGPCLRGG